MLTPASQAYHLLDDDGLRNPRGIFERVPGLTSPDPLILNATGTAEFIETPIEAHVRLLPGVVKQVQCDVRRCSVNTAVARPPRTVHPTVRAARYARTRRHHVRR